MNEIRLKQGTIVPTTGISAGLLTLTIYLIIVYYNGFYTLYNLAASPLLLFYLFLQFSYKDIVFEKGKDEFIIVYRFFYFVTVKRTKSLKQYHTYVLKMIRKSYTIGRGQTSGMTIANGTRKEQYYAIVAKKKSNHDVVQICKGPKKILREIITSNILPNNHNVYLGAPRKDLRFKR